MAEDVYREFGGAAGLSQAAFEAHLEKLPTLFGREAPLHTSKLPRQHMNLIYDTAEYELSGTSKACPVFFLMTAWCLHSPLKLPRRVSHSKQAVVGRGRGDVWCMSSRLHPASVHFRSPSFLRAVG